MENRSIFLYLFYFGTRDEGNKFKLFKWFRVEMFNIWFEKKIELDK